MELGWIIATILGVLAIYAIYAFVSTKIIISMRPKINKCKYCPQRDNCDPNNPRRVCNWDGKDSK